MISKNIALLTIVFSLLACASTTNRTADLELKNCGGYESEKVDALQLQKLNNQQYKLEQISQVEFVQRNKVVADYYSNLVHLCGLNKAGDDSNKAYLKKIKLLDDQYHQVRSRILN